VQPALMWRADTSLTTQFDQGSVADGTSPAIPSIMVRTGRKFYSDQSLQSGRVSGLPEDRIRLLRWKRAS
jgi:hypothetical protein